MNILPAVFLLFRVVLVNPNLLCCHMNFKISFSISVKNYIRILMKISLTLQIASGRMTIFTVLILPAHVRESSFHRLVSTLVSFLSVLKFSFYKFISSFLLSFCEWDFQVYFSVCLFFFLSVNRKAVNFIACHSSESGCLLQKFPGGVFGVSHI